ncbi:MAG: tetratricopeptide repeat protein [Brevinematia bacterium]
MGFFLIFFLFSSALLYSADQIGEVRKLYQNALISIGQGDLFTAETNFIIITRKPYHDREAFRAYISKSYYFLGDIYFIREDFSKAITYYRIVLSKFRDEEISSKALYKLGRTLIMADRVDEGIGVLEEFIMKHPEEKELISSSYYWLGRAYLKKGDRERAISSYNKILQEYPESYFAYEVREKLATLSGIRENIETISNLPAVTNKNILIQKERKEKLDKEKELLKKILTLLEIKQKLLELKMEYLDKIAKEKEENFE